MVFFIRNMVCYPEKQTYTVVNYHFWYGRIKQEENEIQKDQKVKFYLSMTSYKTRFALFESDKYDLMLHW